MAPATVTEYARLTSELGIGDEAIERTVALLDGGNTVPFITRYRRDQTGGLDEEQISRIRDAVAKLRQLEERKQTILRSIESQNKLSDELRREIERADNIKRLEDIYVPFRPKKQSLAMRAREQGLGPLAEEIFAQAKALQRPGRAGRRFCQRRQGTPRRGLCLVGRRAHPGRAVQRTARTCGSGFAACIASAASWSAPRSRTTRRRTASTATTWNFVSRCTTSRRTACWPSIGARRRKCSA